MLSYCKQGTAQEWADAYTERLLQDTVTWPTFNEFAEDMTTRFMDHHCQTRALQELQKLRQETREPLAQFFLRSEELIRQAAMDTATDYEKYIRERIIHAMNMSIARTIVNSREGVPSMYQELKEAAMKIEKN